MSGPQLSSHLPCRCQSHLSITRPLLPRWRAERNLDTPYSLHGTTIFARPVRGTIGGASFLANSRALPLLERSCDAIDCLDVLEYVQDDQAIIAEMARVLRPGGMLRVRVPNAGPLAGLDAYNLYCYLTDITRRGRKPVEIDEVGWRRHYSADDLKELLGPEFVVRTITTHRVGIAELLNVSALALFRWYRRSDARYRRAKAIVERVERIENRIKPRRIGTVLVFEAVRAREI